MKFKGIGEAKAITIAAALELGRRRQLTNTKNGKQIINSQDAYRMVVPFLGDLAHEARRPIRVLGDLVHSWRPIEPEHATVVLLLVGRSRRRDKLRPAFGQDPLTLPDTIPEI